MLCIKSWFCLVFPSQRAVQVGFQRSIQEPSPESTQPIPTWEQTHCLIRLMFFPSSNLTLEDPALAQQPWKGRDSQLCHSITHIWHTNQSWQNSQVRGYVKEHSFASAFPPQPCPKLTSACFRRVRAGSPLLFPFKAHSWDLIFCST